MNIRHDSGLKPAYRAPEAELVYNIVRMVIPVQGIVMPDLQIIPDNDPILRKTSRRVKFVDDELRQLITDMYTAMVQHVGIGLSAIQVGVPKRFFVYEIPNRLCSKHEASSDGEQSEDGDESALEPHDLTKDHPNETEDSETESGEDSTSETGSDSSEDEPPDFGYTGEFTVCINPRVIAREGERIDDEGCLSREGWVAKVKRARRITFQAYDINMEKFERTVEGLEARCVLHETDHLDGILFTDRAEPDTLREISDEDEDGETQDEVGEEAASTPDDSEAVETPVKETA